VARRQTRQRGDALAFYKSDIRVKGPHPFCSSGGNLGTGRCRADGHRTVMYTDSIEQLRGTAGAWRVTFAPRPRWLPSPPPAAAAA
jgi:hypothetical protein